MSRRLLNFTSPMVTKWHEPAGQFVAAALGTGAIAIEISFLALGVLMLIVIVYVVANIIGLF